MEIIIENGATIIKTGDANGGTKNKLNITGVYKHISDDGSIKYRAEIQVDKIRYYLGIRNTVDEVAELRLDAENHVANDTFHEWFKDLKKTSYHSKHKVKGISESRYGNTVKYQAEIRHNGIKHYLGKRNTPEEAAQLIEEAHHQIEKGNFTEWLKSIKKPPKRKY